MNDEEAQVLHHIMLALREAVNGFSALQNSFNERVDKWVPTMPPQSLREWAAWVAFSQAYGHSLLHHHNWVQTLLASYQQNKARMQANPGPPHPDEGQEVAQTPLPDFMKDFEPPKWEEE